MSEDKSLRQAYDAALHQFIERLKEDSSILAVYVFGSYVNGTIWDRSDIDAVIVTNDDRTSGSFLMLQENGVSIQASVYSRADFRRRQQSFIHGSFIHHQLASSKLVYSIDSTISESNRDMIGIAERDKELQLMLSGEFVVRELHKAQKTFYAEQDTEKCFMWIIALAQALARMLLIMHDKIPGRDVLAEARELDNAILNEFIKVFKKGFNEQNLDHIIRTVEEFLLENKEQIYKPLVSYISEVGDSRPASDIDEHFRKVMGSSNFFTLVESYEWLSHHGDLMKVGFPKRITSKSRATVDESAFYYVGGEMV